VCGKFALTVFFSKKNSRNLLVYAQKIDLKGNLLLLINKQAHLKKIHQNRSITEISLVQFELLTKGFSDRSDMLNTLKVSN